MSNRTDTLIARNGSTRRPQPFAPPAPRRFTVAEYYKMAEMGVLSDDQRVELIEGEIIVMSPQGPKHAASGSRASDFLKRLLAEQAIVRVQCPIHLDDFSEPEPDIVVALPNEDYYSEYHPTPKEILMVMEVSYSTLAFDRARKSRIYAEAGIQQYCLLNVRNRELEDYRQPSKDGYRSKQTYTASEAFTLAAFPDLSIKVADLLPPLRRGAGRVARRIK